MNYGCECINSGWNSVKMGSYEDGQFIINVRFRLVNVIVWIDHNKIVVKFVLRWDGMTVPL